jgi:hypothetical protein
MTGSGQELYRVLEKRTLGLLDKLFWVIARSVWSAWKDSLILATPETEDDSLRLPGQPQGSPCLCRSKKLSVSSSASGCALLQSPAVWLVRIAMESAYCLKDSTPSSVALLLAMELAMRVAEVTVCVGIGAPGFLANFWQMIL